MQKRISKNLKTASFTLWAVSSQT